MRWHLSIILAALVLLNTPALTQPTGSIGVYWDQNGFEPDPNWVYDEVPLVYEGYVVVFVEDIVTGAAFGLVDYRNDTTLLNMEYPVGLQIGDAWSGGVEAGFTNPMFGFLDTPLIVGRLALINDVYPNWARIEVEVLPHPDYGAVVYADGEAHLVHLHPQPVTNDTLSFGDLKLLFR